MAAWALSLLLLAPDLGAEIRAALQASGASTSGLGLAVGRAGEPPACAVGADEPRIPASNQKILTAVAALELLGPGFSFETRVGTDAAGDLVVVGDGDPNLSGRFFGGDATTVLRAIAREVRAKGVLRVRDLVLDASRFDAEYVHPEWPRDQLERWYCAPVAALVFNDSCWDVTVAPGARPGAPALVEVGPALVRPAYLNRCATASSGGSIVHLGHAEGHDFEIRGQVVLAGGGISANVTVRDPVRFFGDAFRAALAAEGIAVAGDVREGRLPGARDLVAYRSGLDRTLVVMLENSQNLYSECVFKRLGSGSFAAGAESVAAALRRLEVPTAGLLVRDGSGLSRENRCSARTLYGALQVARDQPLFVEAMPAGGEGTLRKRYKDLGARVRAKTGTIRGVSALSGYVTGREGHRYVFVILANGASAARARRLQDLVVTALARMP